MWKLETPWYELIARGTLVYIIVFILMRIWGKKHLSQVTPFDFILLLFISEAIQNSIVGDDKSLFGGIIVILTFLAWNTLVDRLTFRFPKLEKLLSGHPKVLVQDGILNQDVKHKEYITDQELFTALREQGVDDLGKVKKATIETNGNISVLQNNQ